MSQNPSFTPISITEALQILQSQETRVISEVKRLNFRNTFLATLKYAEQCIKIPTNKIEEVKNILEEKRFSEYQISVFTSLLPQDAAEALFLMPNIEMKEDELESVLREIQMVLEV